MTPLPGETKTPSATISSGPGAQAATSTPIERVSSTETIAPTSTFGIRTAAPSLTTTRDTHLPALQTQTATSTLAKPTITQPTITPTISRAIEEFGYANVTQLHLAYSINAAWGSNVASISLTNRFGRNLMMLTYTINKPPPDDYIIVNRYLDVEQDWRGMRALSIWVENDTTPKQLVVQFGERRPPAPDNFVGEVWRVFVQLPPGQANRIELPWDRFNWVDWSPQQNNRIDLDRIGYYGIGIQGSGIGRGVISFGSISLMSQ